MQVALIPISVVGLWCVLVGTLSQILGLSLHTGGDFIPQRLLVPTVGQKLGWL